jgi:hypothetical protein
MSSTRQDARLGWTPLRSLLATQHSCADTIDSPVKPRTVLLELVDSWWSFECQEVGEDCGPSGAWLSPAERVEKPPLSTRYNDSVAWHRAEREHLLRNDRHVWCGQHLRRRGQPLHAVAMPLDLPPPRTSRFGSQPIHTIGR